MKKAVIETERLRIYAASQDEMEQFIKSQTVDVLKLAYTEMLNGCLNNPDQWEWYAIWMIELKDGTHIGELCFKGLYPDGIAEIGYGISEQYQHNGYASEAVKAVSEWALAQPGVNAVESGITKLLRECSKSAVLLETGSSVRKVRGSRF